MSLTKQVKRLFSAGGHRDGIDFTALLRIDFLFFGVKLVESHVFKCVSALPVLKHQSL